MSNKEAVRRKKTLRKMIRKVFTLKYCSGLIFTSYCYQLFALNENVTFYFLLQPVSVVVSPEMLLAASLRIQVYH